MLCQVCSAPNADDQEYCARCHQRLLVVSGPYEEEELAPFETSADESLSFDEHLLERISILEEVVRRSTGTIRQLLASIRRLDQKLLVNHTGLTSLRDLLAGEELLGREVWNERWESQLEEQLLGLERRERFTRSRGRIMALFGGSDCERFERLIDESEYALLACDVERAIAALEAAYALDRDNHELAFLLAESWFDEADAERARGYFDAVLAVRPKHYECLIYAGVLAHEQGDTDTAIARLEAAVAAYPQAFLPHFCLGAVDAGRGRLASAVRLLETACAIESLPQARYLLGCCQYQLGHTTRAIRNLEAAVASDPDFGEAFHVLGFACLDRAWNRKAHDAFSRALVLAPARLRFEEMLPLLGGSVERPAQTDASRWRLRARSALSGGRARRALASYRRALAREPDNPSLLVSYAMACLELERPRELQSVVGRVIDSDAEERLRATALTTLIESLRSEGEHHEGLRIGRRLLAEGTSDFTRTLANYELAWTLAELGEDLDEALDRARGALASAPTELRMLPLAALGWVHYKRREFDQAVECLSRSTELAPSTSNLTRLGMALLAAGSRERARDVLERAHRLDERTAPLRERVVECLKDSTRLLQLSHGEPRR